MKNAVRFGVMFLLVMCFCSTALAAHLISVTELDQGNTQISWSDAGSNGPYTVCYMMNVTGDFDTDMASTTGLYTIASDVQDTSITTNKLVHGRACWIVVFDTNGDYCVYEHTPAPCAEFAEFTTEVSVQLRTRTDGVYDDVASFSASDIARNGDSKSFGAYIRLTYPELAKTRQYSCMITITNPAGETVVDTVTDMELPSGHSYSYWNFFSLDWYFDVLTQYYGQVDPGVYTWTIYYDGMYVNSQQFTVTE